MKDIQHLAEAYVADPSPVNREAIVMASVPLVRSIIRRLRTPDHPCLELEDLQGVGLLGLIEALDRYDPARRVRFASFAYSRIRGAIIDYVRLIDILPRDRRRDLSEAQRAYDTLCQEQGHAPREQEVADLLGISVEQYQGLLRDAQQRTAFSLHASPSTSELSLLDGELEAEDALEDFERVDQASSIERIQHVVERLPERERQIVHFYYFEGLTQREIGSLFDVSEARISQVMSRILRKLRSAMAEPALAA